MRTVEVVCRNGKYGVIDDDIEAVPCNWKNMVDAISEWEYFEKLNTNEEYPERRFLNHISSIEFIDKIVSKYKKEK
jgi:hypothetical protein